MTRRCVVCGDAPAILTILCRACLLAWCRCGHPAGDHGENLECLHQAPERCRCRKLLTAAALTALTLLAAVPAVPATAWKCGVGERHHRRCPTTSTTTGAAATTTTTVPVPTSHTDPLPVAVTTTTLPPPPPAEVLPAVVDELPVTK